MDKETQQKHRYRMPRKEKKKFKKWCMQIRSITGQGLTKENVQYLLKGMFRKRHTMDILHHSK